jgi:hypothetical protein
MRQFLAGAPSRCERLRAEIELAVDADWPGLDGVRESSQMSGQLELGGHRFVQTPLIRKGP